MHLPSEHNLAAAARLVSGEPGEMTVLSHGSGVPILGSHRRSLGGHTVRHLFYLFLPVAGISTPYAFSCFQHSKCTAFLYVLLLRRDTKLLMELQLWAQVCREVINITGLPRRAGTPLKEIHLWAAGEIIHTAATWNYQQRSETACPVLTPYGWLRLTAMQQILSCVWITNTVNWLLPALSRADSCSRCQTGCWETKALERWHGPTAASPPRATRSHNSISHPAALRTPVLQAGLQQKPEEGVLTFQGLLCQSCLPRDSLIASKCLLLWASPLAF